MTTITRLPTQELVIHQLIPIPQKDFARRMVIAGWNQTKYCDGIIMVHTSPRESDETIHDEITGKLHWTYVEFARYDAIPSPPVIKDGAVEIPVWDMSMHPVFIKFVEWLKTQPEWEAAA